LRRCGNHYVRMVTYRAQALCCVKAPGGAARYTVGSYPKETLFHLPTGIPTEKPCSTTLTPFSESLLIEALRAPFFTTSDSHHHC
jgi:hypothetical protein